MINHELRNSRLIWDLKSKFLKDIFRDLNLSKCSRIPWENFEASWWWKKTMKNGLFLDWEKFALRQIGLDFTQFEINHWKVAPSPARTGRFVSPAKFTETSWENNLNVLRLPVYRNFLNSDRHWENLKEISLDIVTSGSHLIEIQKFQWQNSSWKQNVRLMAFREWRWELNPSSIQLLDNFEFLTSAQILQKQGVHFWQTSKFESWILTR